MKRRNLIAGTGVALGAVALQGVRHKAQATPTLAANASVSSCQLRGWLRQVNLTPAQTAAIQKIDQKFAASIAAQKRVVKREAIALRTLKQRVKAGSNQLKTQEKRQVQALQTYEAVLGAKCFARSEVLTPQQRRQVTRTLAKHPGTSYVATILAA
jgi:Spy/CpxP family protein refolding chaperone